jgi:hypothetical protein
MNLLKLPDEVRMFLAGLDALLYILSISQFALFQTDGSAFSAGSLISAIF